MVINWYGEACFKVVSGALTLVSDAFEAGTGLTPPRFRADILLKTGPFGDYVSEKESEGRSILGPGEYEVKGVHITGAPAGESAVYAAKMEEMKLGFLGELATANIPADTMEMLRNCDILFVPAGGKPHIAQDDAVKLIKKLEPKIVLLSCIETPGLKRKAGDVMTFEKALGQKVAVEEKLTIKAKEMTWEGTRYFALKI